jgi:hypothetical protein
VSGMQEGRTKVSETIRVLRLVEYEGPRELVEPQVARSIQGTRLVMEGRRPGVRITATTLGTFPEIIEEARKTPDPRYIQDLQSEIRRLREQGRERG